MDFLTRLPFDLRVELLSQIEMGTNMLPLMKTSPPMIPAYCDIRCRFYKALFNECMMQDALAIVFFPSRIVPWTEDSIRLALINNWREGQFADHFKNHDYVTINSLDKL
ncbi:hypothetical protein FOIG_10606 [Fusarium odoratissimum NRRL 54006]|uniref:Uncharacterized protein n=2 Tax=Fusarium oxysporum species complex TaxID=171631 RepID=X0JMN2_FUSO5|nr:uncharacterized protein FOIG_10606 [Fusarium odoratissimum NRRL 54006]EXL97580.1 hypothetical protein FOIG_10606 [Fusarium odoratissimum NRRL 54006]TXB96161.1 hypothetical protein FocTR4_00015819 [Fusarium oxysporum f. sp. cubense]